MATNLVRLINEVKVKLQDNARDLKKTADRRKAAYEGVLAKSLRAEEAATRATTSDFYEVRLREMLAKMEELGYTEPTKIESKYRYILFKCRKAAGSERLHCEAFVRATNRGLVLNVGAYSTYRNIQKYLGIILYITYFSTMKVTNNELNIIMEDSTHG